MHPAQQNSEFERLIVFDWTIENVLLPNLIEFNPWIEFNWVRLKGRSIALLLVFSVTPFKIYQTKIQNRSIDKVRNLESKRR